MYFEIPEFKRCVFCVPLRCGIILFGCLNLFLTSLLMALEAWLGWGEPVTASTMSLYRGVAMHTQVWLCMVLYSLEIVFNLILIVGALMKRKMLLRLYFYYGLTTTAATFVTLLVLWVYYFQSEYMKFHFVDIALHISTFTVHIYLLLLIRSELLKIRYQSGMAIVNHVAEVVNPIPWGEGRNPF